MKDLKGGHLWSWNGSHDLKRLLMRFVCFILLGFETSTKDLIQSLDWFYLPLFLLLPPVSSKCFSLIRLDLALHIVPQIGYLRFTLKGRRVP
jgi:hypothetical protein